MKKLLNKHFTANLKNKAGRSKGRITSPRRGAYKKRRQTFIDMKRIVFCNKKGYVKEIIKRSGKEADIMKICYTEGLYTYAIAPYNMKVGHIVRNNTIQPKHKGDSAKLYFIPSGSVIHNISLHEEGIGKISRAPGTSSILVRQNVEKGTLLKLKSGEYRYFLEKHIATMGRVGTEDHFLNKHYKAGEVRLLGRRPRTRPTAMNPVDHPMGGRTRGGFQPTNRKGLITTHRPTKIIRNPHILYTKRQMKFRGGRF